MSFQQITIVGNVGRDAELAYTPQGVAVAKFSVATSKRTGQGENKKEVTTWFNVTLWRERAENLSQYIKSGKKIMIIGEISVSVYTDRSGAPAASLELTASQVIFLDSNQNGNKGGGSSAAGTGSTGEPSTSGEQAYDQVGDIPF